MICMVGAGAGGLDGEECVFARRRAEEDSKCRRGAELGGEGIVNVCKCSGEWAVRILEKGGWVGNGSRTERIAVNNTPSRAVSGALSSTERGALAISHAVTGPEI